MLRPIKTEPIRIKGERPSLHLQIPPPSGCLSTSSQPSSAESAFPFTPETASSVFSPDGPLRTPGPSDVQTTSYSKPPYSQPNSSPLQASSGYPLTGPQGTPQGRPSSLGPLDLQPGTPRRAQHVDPFFKPQQQMFPQSSQEPGGTPESPRPKTGDSPLFSPPHTPHGDCYRTQQGILRQEYASSPSPSAVASSPGAMTQNMSVPSPRASTSRQDFGIGSPAGILDSGEGLFKAPMTPRTHQGDSGGASTPHPAGASPGHHPDTYRQSPSTFSDSCAQSPHTPRPQPGDCPSPLLQRLPGPQPEVYPKVVSSPQSQGSCQSPLTPGALSNDGLSIHSPATPRFQSPDPHSRPPSRPQSRDAFTSLPKPARSEASFRGSPHSSSNQQPPCSPSVGDPLTGKPSAPAAFSHSPGSDALQPGLIPKQVLTPQQAQAQLQQPFLPQCTGPDANTKPLLTPGNQDVTAVRPPDTAHIAELPDLSSGQDPALIGLSPSEIEKHRQVEARLRIINAILSRLLSSLSSKLEPRCFFLNLETETSRIFDQAENAPEFTSPGERSERGQW